MQYTKPNIKLLNANKTLITEQSTTLSQGYHSRSKDNVLLFFCCVTKALTQPSICKMSSLQG